MIDNNLATLKVLSEQFPTIASVSSEIINLEAILKLPKGTEHFISDLHGEYEAVTHILNNASGIIREKIDEMYSETLNEEKRTELATLIYYPSEKLISLKEKYKDNITSWYIEVMDDMVNFAKVVSFKYSRSKTRRRTPAQYLYIIEELLYADLSLPNHHKQIFESIISIGRADDFIEQLSVFIKRLIVDRLHVLGDIFDRGPGAQKIMAKLMDYHSVDFVWGNHDMLWIGAASGNEVCIANVLNVSLSYANVDTLENGYGISLRPLMAFAEKTYGDSSAYNPKVIEKGKIGLNDVGLVAKIRRAAAILQFKLEGQTILRHPEYHMEDRLVLNHIDYENGTIEAYGKTYQLKDKSFPTIDPKDPYKLTDDERAVIDAMKDSFLRSETLQRQITFLINNGAIYRIYNGNLLMHGCLPINDDVTLMEFEHGGHTYSGREFFDYCDMMVRNGFFGKNGSKEKQSGLDIMWWLWAGKNSPVFGKTRMTTFERLLVEDKESHHEPKNAFYKNVDNPELLSLIAKEFKLSSDTGHVIVGHIPVKAQRGENPSHLNGRFLMIDGGFCKAYQPETGIAGYTLVYNSYGMRIISHEAFTSISDAITNNSDIVAISNVVDKAPRRMTIADTNSGKEMKEKVDVLKMLLEAYRAGLIPQNS